MDLTLTMKSNLNTFRPSVHQILILLMEVYFNYINKINNLNYSFNLPLKYLFISNFEVVDYDIIFEINFYQICLYYLHFLLILC